MKNFFRIQSLHKKIGAAFFCALLSCFISIYAEEGSYDIPPSIRFTLEKEESTGNFPLVYYLSYPQEGEASYPIFVLCDGSEYKGGEGSVYHVRKFFEQKVGELHAGYLTVEKYGIDGNQKDLQQFWQNYTVSQRLKDHLQVISYIEKNPPIGWNGKFIFAGIAEGALIATDLSLLLSDNTLATVNWSAAPNYAWDDHLWNFLAEDKKVSLSRKIQDAMPRWTPFSSDVPSNRDDFDILFHKALANPTSDHWFAGLTYLYHADALQRATVDPTKIKKPFLLVSGTKDCIIESCDQFAKEGWEAGAPITYFRIEGMDHYIRKHPDVINQSFDWLKTCIDNAK